MSSHVVYTFMIKLNKKQTSNKFKIPFFDYYYYFFTTYYKSLYILITYAKFAKMGITIDKKSIETS